MTKPLPILAESQVTTLLEILGAQINESMLREIAAADYGHGAEEHYSHLRRMKDEGIIPTDTWYPLEVLELIRWSEPDQGGWKPGGHGRRGHLMRAFCSAWLLRIAVESDHHAIVSANETAIQLVASLDSLDLEAWTEAVAFLTWFIPHWSAKEDGEEDPLLGIALMHCGLRAPGIHDDRLIELCEWIVAREEAIGTSWRFSLGVGLRASRDNIKRHQWRDLGRTMTRLDLKGCKRNLRDWVKLIGESIADS